MIAEALTIYNYVVSSQRWDYTNPKDAKILALVTKVDILEAKVKYSTNTTQKQPQRLAGNINPAENSKYLIIDHWRMKRGEQMVERDSKTLYWCPQHNLPGKYDGIYVTDKLGDHEEWLKNGARFKNDLIRMKKSNPDQK